jgi:hypothetical protein
MQRNPFGSIDSVLLYPWGVEPNQIGSVPTFPTIRDGYRKTESNRMNRIIRMSGTSQGQQSHGMPYQCPHDASSRQRFGAN